MININNLPTNELPRILAKLAQDAEANNMHKTAKELREAVLIAETELPTKH